MVAEVGGVERGGAVGQALERAQPRGQRLERRRCAAPRQWRARARGSASRTGRRSPGRSPSPAAPPTASAVGAWNCDAEAVAALVLALQQQPRARAVLALEPRLVEERRLHHPGRVGDDRLDERLHPAPAHRAAGDRAHLDDHRRASRPSVSSPIVRASLAVAREVLEQVADGQQPEPLGALGGRRRLDLERRLQPRRARVARRAGGVQVVVGQRRRWWRRRRITPSIVTSGAVALESRRTARHNERDVMDTYVILRRNAWATAPTLEQAAGKSSQVGDEEMSDDIRWIRSYVLEEPGGGLGTVCIYQGSSEEKVREHAQRAGLPADEVIKVADTVARPPRPGVGVASGPAASASSTRPSPRRARGPAPAARRGRGRGARRTSSTTRPARRVASVRQRRPDRRCRRTRAPRGAPATRSRTRLAARARRGPVSRGRPPPRTHTGWMPEARMRRSEPGAAGGGHHPQPAVPAGERERAAVGRPRRRVVARPGADDAHELRGRRRVDRDLARDPVDGRPRRRHQAAVGRHGGIPQLVPGIGGHQALAGEVGVGRQQADPLLERRLVGGLVAQQAAAEPVGRDRRARDGVAAAAVGAGEEQVRRQARASGSRPGTAPASR